MSEELLCECDLRRMQEDYKRRACVIRKAVPLYITLHLSGI
jgi:metal-responsive CopG/Arc/MetJ family transcriptional regulator